MIVHNIFDIVATLRLAQTRVCKLQSKVLTYH